MLHIGLISYLSFYKLRHLFIYFYYFYEIAVLQYLFISIICLWHCCVPHVGHVHQWLGSGGCLVTEQDVWLDVFWVGHITGFHISLERYSACWFSCFRKDSRYTEKDAAIIVRQMLKVAAECHLHGLVHRDMKPEVIVGQEMEDVLFLVVESLVDHASQLISLSLMK